MLWLAACSGGGSGGGAAAADPSQLLDTDADGEFDLAKVGDWDGDGVLALRDVQAAIDALTDKGPKRVELSPGATFRPDGMLSAGSNAHGLVELRSDTTLDCRGATLEGIDDSAFVRGNWPSLLVTLTNADHQSYTDTRIHIVNCVVTGGMPQSYDSLGWSNNNYMGVAFFGVRDGSIVSNTVRDTHHTCIYVKNSTDILIENNLMEGCGAAHDVQSHPKQPGIYLFQGGPNPTERIVVRGNTVLSAGNALYNTRISGGNSQYQTAWMRDIVFEANYGEDDDGDVCFNLRGPRHVVVRDNTCRATAGIYLAHQNDAYCADNPATRIDGDGESACLEDVTIQDNLLLDGVAENSNGMIAINDHHDGVVLRDNAVIRVSGPSPSLRIQPPVRNLVIDGLTLADCATSCVRVDGLPQHAPPPDERLQLRNLSADGAGFVGITERQHACLHVASRIEDALFENFHTDRCRSGVWIGAPFAGVMRAFEIDGLSAGYLGSVDLASGALPACDASRDDRWLVLRGSDGTCSGAPGASELRCACRDGSWTSAMASPQPGIRVDFSNGLRIERGLIQNVDGQNGIVFGSLGNHDAEVVDVEFDQPRLGDGILAPMLRGVWDASQQQRVQVSGVVCRPGAVSGACVDL